MSQRKIIVTHHAPDLDAIASVWLLKRFDAQTYAMAKVAYVDPGSLLDPKEAVRLGSEPHMVVHVDTGRGEFDHHTEDKNLSSICAATLVLDHLEKQRPELKNDTALRALVRFVTEIDHFGEVYWPEPENDRYVFMLHELIHGEEFSDHHTDDSQMHFGMMALDNAYNILKQQHRAKEILEAKGTMFSISEGKCLAIETKNDDVIKIAQKQGIMLVIRKDPKLGNIRIKARPDSKLTLETLHSKIQEIDSIGTWYFHPSGKMLINGSKKHTSQQASPLSLAKIIELVKMLYGSSADKNI